MMKPVLATVTALWFVCVPAMGVLPVVRSRPAQHSLDRFPGMRLAFERDGGRYVARGVDYRLDVSAGESVLRYDEGFGDVDQWFREEEFRLQLVGASALSGQPLEDMRHDSVGFSEVYPKIDLVCSGKPERLEYRFAAASGADVGLIRIRFQGAHKVRVEGDGSLRAGTPLGEVRVYKPVTRDPFDGEWRRVEGRFVLRHKDIVEFQARPN